MKIDERYSLDKLDGNYVIVKKDEASGENKLFMKINQSGAVIWVLVEKNMSPKEILSQIVDLYRIDEETAKKDINNFLNFLLEQKILML